jgi:glycosyltransferase involved in cell wall biosynthesis
MVVVPWGVDTHAFSSDPLVGQALRRELGFGDDEMMVFAAGRLVYKKGFDYLLRAAPMVLERKPRTRFVIAGDGDLAGELQSLAASLGVGERVHFAGSVSREQIGAYFSACDVFVVPSVQDREGNVDGLPTVLMEAMAAAKPIVATRVAGIPLVMTDGENGLLVEEKDPAQLAEAVTRLLASPELRARMGQAGERRVRDELNWRHIADIFVELYRQAITRRCPERSG